MTFESVHSRQDYTQGFGTCERSLGLFCFWESPRRLV